MKILKDKAILIVDDDSVLRHILSEFFSQVCRTTFEANGAIAAQKIFNSTRVDVIISDWKMPKGNGEQLLQKVSDLPEPRPMVFIMTAHGGLWEEELVMLGATALIHKPFRREALLDLIEKKMSAPPSAKQSA